MKPNIDWVIHGCGNGVVLEDCDGAVSLTYLYEQIEPHKKAQANKWWKEKIRQTLQCNPEHFNHDGRGLWSLRTAV